MGEVIFSAAALAVVVGLHPFVIRWAYWLQPDPLDGRQVARQRNCRVFAWTVPLLIVFVAVRLAVAIARLH